MQAVMETYKRLGIAPTRGEGSWLFDDEGNRYLDFIGGIATNSLGHGHPALVEAIQEQAEKFVHMAGTDFYLPEAVALAETLASWAGTCAVEADKVCVGQEINANHIRPVRAGWVYGVATPEALGRSSQVWSIRITDEAGKLVCISRMTLAVVLAKGV